MKELKYQQLKIKCIEAKADLNSAVSAMKDEMQPFFKREIDVFYQASDGFVVVFDMGAQYAPLNIPIDEVFENIRTNNNYYKQKHNEYIKSTLIR